MYKCVYLVDMIVGFFFLCLVILECSYGIAGYNYYICRIYIGDLGFNMDKK